MDDSALENSLSCLGFTEREARVYLTLLRFGKHPTSFVANKINLSRGTTHSVLHALLRRGIVSMSTKNKVQYFAPLEPKKLLTHIERRAQELSEQAQLARNIIPELDSIAPSISARPTVEYFSGVEGMRTALDDTLMANEKTLRTYSSSLDMTRVLGEYFEGEYTEERIRRGYRLQSIQSYVKDSLVMSKDNYTDKYGTCKKANREVRYTRNKLIFPMSLYIYDHKVLVISSSDENFASITESREYAEMQKEIFYEIWNSLPASEVK